MSNVIFTRSVKEARAAALIEHICLQMVDAGHLHPIVLEDLYRDLTWPRPDIEAALDELVARGHIFLAAVDGVVLVSPIVSDNWTPLPWRRCGDLDRDAA